MFFFELAAISFAWLKGSGLFLSRRQAGRRNAEEEVSTIDRCTFIKIACN
jgi:hypothetical protein